MTTCVMQAIIRVRIGSGAFSFAAKNISNNMLINTNKLIISSMIELKEALNTSPRVVEKQNSILH
jgi:hypothetical protein